ncbi:unnamed protein product [Malus baccata var. baccata]
MDVDDVPLDEKAKRMRDLLSSFYSPDPSQSSPNSNSSCQRLLQRHVQMAAEIKNLDTDLQMLVYENYNKLISATDTIKHSNVGVNTSLSEKREHIEKLHRTHNLLRKVQFIYDLPARLGKCIKSEAYADAVKFYTGAIPIFKAYGDSSFHDCNRASEEAVTIIIKNLQGKLFSDSESIQARAEAAVLLKQLDFPVDSLKVKLLEKLEQSVAGLQLKIEDIGNSSLDSNDPSTDTVPATAHETSVHEFAEAVRAYRVIFPDSDTQLTKLAQDLVAGHFKTTEQCIKTEIWSADPLGVLRIIWRDVLLVDDVLNEAALPDYSLEAARVTVKLYVSNKFSHLLNNSSDALTKAHTRQKDREEYSLQVALEGGKKAEASSLCYCTGCLSLYSITSFQDFRQLLDDNLELLVKLKDLIIDWVQEGFQDFFRALEGHFLLLSGKNSSASQDQGLTEGIQDDKVLAGLVLVLAQVSVFIEQNAIPRVTCSLKNINTGEIAASFSGGGVRGYEYGPTFIPGEICRIFRSAGEKFLHSHKEPREVHMFVDLFLQELEAIRSEVKQILPQGVCRHRRADSNGSTASSQSNPLREEKLSRSNTWRARSQLLETHLAKLFKQKVEIVTKVDFTQVMNYLQKFFRLQTFNRSGFQQIQLDIQFLRTPLKEMAEDEAAVGFLLDEVIVAAAGRCLDPIPLEPAILDKLTQLKLAKTREQKPISP